MGLQTAGLCYAQPLNNGIFTSCEYHLLRQTLSVTPLRNLPVNKKTFFANSSSMSQKSVCATNFRRFGEIGANFPVQHCKQSLLKLTINKLSPKINMKN